MWRSEVQNYVYESAELHAHLKQIPQYLREDRMQELEGTS